MGGIMKICRFVSKELQRLREECNFTDEELEYFNMKAKDYTDIEIALRMNISEAKVAVLSKHVRCKIEKVQKGDT